MKQVLAALLLLPCVAVAAPAHLECVTKADHPQPGAAATFEFSVTVDDANNSVTHTTSAGEIFKAEGFFSVNKIAYQYVELSTAFRTTVRYQIDRNDLSVARTFSSELTPEGMESLRDWNAAESAITTRGQCRLQAVGKRKI